VRLFALLFLIWSQWSLATALNEHELEGAWLEADSKWVNAPKDVAPRTQSGQTAVLYFGRDHKFALIYCTVIRVAKDHLNISNGDPRSVFRGEWSIHGNTISLTYQLVEQTIVVQGRELPGPIHTQI